MPMGISASEADKLIAEIQELQRQVKSGEAPPSGLLSGGSISTSAVKIAPEEIFVNMPFDRAFIIEREEPVNRFWRPYSIVVRPKIATTDRNLIWEIEVVLGANDKIERVEMSYKPAPPF